MSDRTIRTLNDEGHKNWVQGGLGLLFVQTLLSNILDHHLKGQYENIFRGNTETTEKYKSIKNNVKRCHLFGIDKWTNSKLQNNETPDEERYNHVEFGKCFIKPTGYLEMKNISDIDMAGLVHIFINNTDLHEKRLKRPPEKDNQKKDQQLKEPNVFSQALAVRNSIFHSSKQCLTTESLCQYLLQLIEFIANIEPDKSCGTEEEIQQTKEDLTKLKNIGFQVSPEDEDKVRKLISDMTLLADKQQRDFENHESRICDLERSQKEPDERSPSLCLTSPVYPINGRADTSTTKAITEGAEALQVSGKDAPSRREQSSHFNILWSPERTLNREESSTDKLPSLEIDCPPPLMSTKHSMKTSIKCSEQLSNLSMESKQGSTQIQEVLQTCRIDSNLHTEGKRDFVIMHDEDDREEAQKYMNHLIADIFREDPDFPNFSVDLFGEIDIGKTDFRSLDQLHDKYINILVLVTQNLANSDYSRNLIEILITKGLKQKNGKEDRVIPIWVTTDCIDKMTEISHIHGFRYNYFLTDRVSMAARHYVKCVKNTVEKGRKWFN